MPSTSLSPDRPSFLRLSAGLLLLCLLVATLRAQSVTATFAGVTTTNFIEAGALNTNIPVGSAWTATVTWDAGAATMSSTSTQAQYRLTGMSLTLQGVSEAWTTSAIAGEFAPSFTTNYVSGGAQDEIQFTSGWGPAVHTNATLYEWAPYSINLVLTDPTGAAIPSLTPAPSSLSLADWSTNVSNSYLKLYLNNDGNRYLLGSIQSINGSDSGTPDTPTPPSGEVTVGSGTLTVTDVSALGTGATVSASATLDLQNVTADVSVTLGGGTLSASTGTSSLAGNLTVSATSTVDVSGTQLTVSGTVSGSFGFTKTGAGALTLSGTNTFTGQTTVSTGTLLLQNSSVGSVQISAGGLLAGVGTVRGDLGNGGLLIPGFSPGTITVDGGFSQSSAGRLRMELASATEFDRLIVGGTATLGGTLEVATLPGFTYQVGDSYAIFTAGSVTGTFAAVETPFSALPLGIRFATLYGPTAVTLAFQQQPFAPYALTAAQAGVAGALDAALAAGRAPGLQGMFNTYTGAAHVRAALDQLAPVGYTHWFGAALSQADAIGRALREPHAGTTAPNGVRAWAEVFRRDADFATQPGEPATNLSGNGVIAAVDWQGAGDWAVGALLAYENASLDGVGRADVRSFQPVVTVRREAGAWRTDLALGRAWHDYDVSRPVALPGFAGVTAQGESSGRHWFASVRQSYTMDLDNWNFIPALEVQHFNWRADGFSEVGAGEASLQVGGQSGRSLAGKAGMRLAYATSLDRAKIAPFIEAGWRHEFRRGSRQFDAELAGSSFTTASLPPSSGGWTFAAGVNAAVTDRLNLAIRYQRETDTAVDAANDWQARLDYGF